MNGETQRRRLETCPNCRGPIDVEDEQPLARVNCPSCGKLTSVRSRFNQFEITKKIGEGGMSRVYRATDRSLGRDVALKILNRKFSTDSERVAQFEKEARITALVSHPNIVRIYSVGRAQGLFFIAMELVGGGSLEQRIREGRIPEDEMMVYSIGIAKGLRAAHTAGHRDIKPGNILFSTGGIPKIVDFGLSLISTEIDTSGEIWATPYYVPPEKLANRPDTFRGDMYSMGATVFHALVGRPPHDARTASIAELKKIKAEPVHLADSLPEVSEQTSQVIDRLLEQDPGLRPATYDELIDELLLTATALENPDDVQLLSRIDVPSAAEIRRRHEKQSAKVFWAAGILASIALITGLVVLMLTSGSKPESNPITPQPEITTTPSPDLPPDITGPEIPDLDTPSIADRFLEARSEMFAGSIESSRKTFSEIAATLDARPSTRCWARYNLGIGHLLDGRIDAARNEFGRIPAIAEAASDDEGMEPWAAEFFRDTERLVNRDGIPEPHLKEYFPSDDPHALGLLVLGLQTWQEGDWDNALDFFDSFDVVKRTGSYAWVDGYKALLNDFRNDYEVLLKEPLLLDQDTISMSDLADARETYMEMQGEFLTRGRVHTLVKTQLEFLDALEAANEASDAHTQTEDEKIRVASLNREEMADLQNVVSDLRTGRYRSEYRFADGLEVLRKAGLGYHSEIVSDALDSHVYLWKSAEEFLETFVSDLNAGGFRGLGASPFAAQGEIVGATRDHIIVGLEFGETKFAIADLAPEVIIDMALRMAERIPNSTEHYHRRELAVAFAKLVGSHDRADWIAGRLMNEHRMFREKWLRMVEVTY